MRYVHSRPTILTPIILKKMPAGLDLIHICTLRIPE